MTRRRQADRTAATRGALIAAAREQFAAAGFAGTGLEAVSVAAGVSRGAAYHQFGSKLELFAAVLVEVEAGIADRIAVAALAGEDLGFQAVLRRAMTAWLDECSAQDVQRILLVDGPSVLGWSRWRELLQPYALTLVVQLLATAIENGELPALPVRALAHTLVAVADEAALVVATSEHPEASREEMLRVLDALVAGLSRPSP